MFYTHNFVDLYFTINMVVFIRHQTIAFVLTVLRGYKRCNVKIRNTVP